MKITRRHIIHLHIILLSGLLATAIFLLLGNIYTEKVNLKQPVTFGVSFSPKYAVEMNLNPREMYSQILKDLKPKSIRLNAYWDDIEPEMQNFDFSELDFYINEAKLTNTKIILAVGYKLPRWPECRAPKWLDTSDELMLRERQMVMVKKVISYFDPNPTITAFQIENEPMLAYGICPKPDQQFLEMEVKIARNLTHKPIIVTDTGELRTWDTPMRLSDVFGTTLYREVSDKIFGVIYYPIPPWFYKVKSDIVRTLFAPQNQKTIVSELQAEIWAGGPIVDIPIDEQLRRYNLDKLKNTVSYARRTGFDEFYLWGVEWWYYLASYGHPEYLDYAKTLF